MWIVAFVTWCSFIGTESFLHFRGKNGEKGGVGKIGSNSDFNGIFSTSNWALHTLKFKSGKIQRFQTVNSAVLADVCLYTHFDRVFLECIKALAERESIHETVGDFSHEMLVVDLGVHDTFAMRRSEV